MLALSFVVISININKQNVIIYFFHFLSLSASKRITKKKDLRYKILKIFLPSQYLQTYFPKRN